MREELKILFDTCKTIIQDIYLPNHTYSEEEQSCPPRISSAVLINDCTIISQREHELLGVSFYIPQKLKGTQELLKEIEIALPLLESKLYGGKEEDFSWICIECPIVSVDVSTNEAVLITKYFNVLLEKIGEQDISLLESLKEISLQRLEHFLVNIEYNRSDGITCRILNSTPHFQRKIRKKIGATPTYWNTVWNVNTTQVHVFRTEQDLVETLLDKK